MQDFTRKFLTLASEAFHHGLELSSPEVRLRESLEVVGPGIRTGKRTWSGEGRVAVIAAGKAALPMARAAESILGTRLDGGVLVAPSSADRVPWGFESFVAEHPAPGEGSAAAAARVAEVARELGEDDLLLFLLSGGASSLLGSPDPALGAAEFLALWQALLSCGADIIDMNIVRKHCSLLGGGRLAALAAPARVETLAISDVPGDDPASIGSGPCVADDSTFAQALGVLERYGLSERHAAAARFLKDGMTGNRDETLKPASPRAGRCGFTLLDGAGEVLKRMAIQLTLIPGVRVWERAQMGGIDYQARRLLRELERAAQQSGGRPRALLCAGEPTAAVPGHAGTGGRASHYALEFLLAAEKSGLRKFVLLSGASDGADGNSGAAGAIVSHESLPRMRARGLAPEEFLERFDSGSLFAGTGEQVLTGPTGTNVSDIRIGITW